MKSGVIIISTGLLLALSWTEGESSDRARDGYLGDVKSVVTEKAAISNVSGEWVEGPRSLAKDEKYDADGVRTEIAEYTGKGVLWYRETQTRGPDGTVTTHRINYELDGTPKEERTHTVSPRGVRVTEIILYNIDGSVASKDVQTYDPNASKVPAPSEGEGPPENQISQFLDEEGNKVVERTEFNPDGSNKSRTIQVYGKNGRLVESAVYGHDGSLVRKTLFTHDVERRFVEEARYRGNGTLEFTSARLTSDAGIVVEIEQANYDGSGSLKSRLTRRFDERGNLTEALSFHAAQAETEAIAYEYAYDPTGNWIKRTTLKSVSPAEPPERIPVEAAYRTIIYYDR